MGLFEDHPRLCGEKQHDFKHFTPPLGSPPPMRGKAGIAFAVLVVVGITPAYAGKRSWRFKFHVNLQDHPRLCGEKLYCFTTAEKPSGSPPPMRGKD